MGKRIMMIVMMWGIVFTGDSWGGQTIIFKSGNKLKCDVAFEYGDTVTCLLDGEEKKYPAAGVERIESIGGGKTDKSEPSCGFVKDDENLVETMKRDAENRQMLDHAVAAAHVRIEKVLKSPSTAKHPREISPEKVCRYMGRDLFKCRSYVDSQNAFGATVRTHYEMILDRGKYNSWSVKDVKVLK